MEFYGLTYAIILAPALPQNAEDDIYGAGSQRTTNALATTIAPSRTQFRATRCVLVRAEACYDGPRTTSLFTFAGPGLHDDVRDWHHTAAPQHPLHVDKLFCGGLPLMALS